MRRLYSPAQNRAAEMIVRPIPRNGLQLAVDLWHINQQGFLASLDGNDYFSRTVADYRLADGEGAIVIWFRSSSASNQCLLGSSDTATTSYFMQLWVNGGTGRITIDQKNNDTTDSISGSTNILDGKIHHIVFSSSGTAYTIILDGVAETLIVSAGANSGDWFADTPNRDSLTIGVLERSSLVNYVTGEISSTRIYSRPILQPEAQTNYQRGRKAAPSDTTGLVGSWDFTEGSGDTATDTIAAENLTRTGATWVEGLTDRSPNALALTSFGSPTWSNQGRTFDGSDDRINIDHNSVFNIPSAGSLVIWQKCSSFAKYRNLIQKLNDDNVDNDPFLLRLQITTGAAFGRIQTAGGVANTITGTTAGVLDTWSMHTFTWDLSWLNLYLNGVADATPVAVTVTPMTNSAPVTIGGKGSLDRRFIGGIGEAWLYSRALSAAEVQQNYLATKWKYV